ncbi:hypothetical protein MLD38_024615 [Melastoma candidum]|uniref:Uncharacterized protein n=1 Tax=Melastoma candidum TaxID=119954 RepID=A0ACB9NSJ4_9MYRT|nr:hypothetical protein MLD38_024615 [Melastoma candidum]
MLYSATTSYLAVVVAVAAVTSSQIISPDCQSSCGNVSIPYPFGNTPGCYLNSFFLISCRPSTEGNGNFNVSKPYLGTSSIEVLGITLAGELKVNLFVGNDCYTQSGAQQLSFYAFANLPTFPVSTTRNKFTAIGCDTVAAVDGSSGNGFATGCLSICGGIDSLTDGECNGIGCCQTTIPSNLVSFNVSVSSIRNHTTVWSFNPCSYVFIVEESAYQFSRSDLKIWNKTVMPAVLDWSIWQETCENTTTHACKANSDCIDVKDVSGYRCNCSSGYQGNPYLGCTDKNECEDPNLNDCVVKKLCENTPGNYSCTCPKWYIGDGRKSGDGCTINESLVKVIVIVVAGSAVLLMSIFGFLYFGLKKRKFLKQKEKYFRQNGGILLQQQLHERVGGSSGSMNSSARIFSAEELKEATNDFNESRIIGRGGFGVVYKGNLRNGEVVAIKKPKLVDQSQFEQFVNEVVVLSQINHRNVVKLLGCCLETEVPLLVYEFINNGTLFDHIHNKAKSSKVPWDTRLRIATEAAGVLSYLHSAASIPIIHRDVKSTNILLDESYTAKVSDFGASRLVPLDHAQLSTMVQGTIGYLDPEYMLTCQLTEKSDVYSFGVVLVELMTGKKALSFDRPEEERSLAMYFLSCLKDDLLFDIVEEFISEEEGNRKQLIEVATLAKRCLRVKGEERPSMKEVAMELEGIRAMVSHPWVTMGRNPEEMTELLQERFESIEYATGSGTTSYSESTGYSYSMKNHVMPPVSSGR